MFVLGLMDVEKQEDEEEDENEGEEGEGEELGGQEDKEGEQKGNREDEDQGEEKGGGGKRSTKLEPGHDGEAVEGGGGHRPGESNIFVFAPPLRMIVSISTVI